MKRPTQHTVWPRSFAPGMADMEPGYASAKGAGAVQLCPGCRAHPLPECAACGAPTDITLPAGEHTLTLCRRCYRVLQAVRAQGAVEHVKHPGRHTSTKPAKSSKSSKSSKTGKQSPAIPPTPEPGAPARQRSKRSTQKQKRGAA